MAQQGYWAVCEPLFSEGKREKEPSAYFVQIPGFYYADAMAPTQLEAMVMAAEKLYKNIGFLERCHCDIPPPQSSAEPPEERFPDGAVVFFISREQLDRFEEKPDKKAA